MANPGAILMTVFVIIISILFGKYNESHLRQAKWRPPRVKIYS